MPRSGNTTARGYGHDHKVQRAAAKVIVDAGDATCWRCGKPIEPGTPWDLGHDDKDRAITRGPEHRSCNRSAAAIKGNAMRAIDPLGSLSEDW